MTKVKKNIIEITIFLLVVLFVYASLSKVLDFQKFRIQLGQSPLLTSFAGWIVWIVPILELFNSFILAIPKYRLIGLYASFSLMVMFSGYIFVITKFSEYVPCSCGGVLQHMNWNQHLTFNIGIVLICIISILLYDQNRFVAIKSGTAENL